MAFISSGYQIEKQDDPLDEMIFELQLEENQLWLFAYTGLSEGMKFYLKRFNDGSKYFEFIKSLFNKYAQGGYVEIPLEKNQNLSCKR